MRLWETKPISKAPPAPNSVDAITSTKEKVIGLTYRILSTWRSKVTTKSKVGDPVIYTGKSPIVHTNKLIGCIGWVVSCTKGHDDVDELVQVRFLERPPIGDLSPYDTFSA